MLRNATTCSLCDKPVYRRGWCEMHHTRWRRRGDPNVVLRPGTSRKSDPVHATVHKRLYKDRGKASEYLCVDCGKQARDWSYKYGGVGLPFSTNLDDYEPRCRSCHKKLDKPRPSCSTDGCGAPHQARGMCRKHYQRWWHNQRVLQTATLSPQEEMRETSE